MACIVLWFCGYEAEFNCFLRSCAVHTWGWSGLEDFGRLHWIVQETSILIILFNLTSCRSRISSILKWKMDATDKLWFVEGSGPVRITKASVQELINVKYMFLCGFSTLLLTAPNTISRLAIVWLSHYALAASPIFTHNPPCAKSLGSNERREPTDIHKHTWLNGTWAKISRCFSYLWHWPRKMERGSREVAPQCPM